MYTNWLWLVEGRPYCQYRLYPSNQRAMLPSMTITAQTQNESVKNISLPRWLSRFLMHIFPWSVLMVTLWLMIDGSLLTRMMMIRILSSVQVEWFSSPLGLYSSEGDDPHPLIKHHYVNCIIGMNCFISTCKYFHETNTASLVIQNAVEWKVSTFS
jgi:hypothetical protein